MSSSSLLAERKVDVFLSFCSDTDYDFEPYLVQNGIITFKSDGWVETRVRRIDERTLAALEESKVAVVMTSETKSCSVGFLEELIAILEFQEKGSLTVIPIYPTADSFDVEEDICQQYPENAASWRDALTKLANIAAEYPFSGDLSWVVESDRFEQIAHDILLIVHSSTSNYLNALVAMDRHMKVVYDLLASEVTNEVRTIGIWGSAGVGKTTLARYISAEISVDFQTHVFLENVENTKDMILKFEGEEDPTVIRSFDHDWHEIIEARRKHQKVLLIADDVNYIEQGMWIIEYANWFAPGSRVILISQNKTLLVDAGAMDLYEVRTLRYDEALQLFSHFSFKQQPYPPPDFEQLAVRAVHLAGFLPLALRLLGSFLSGKGREEWIAALLKLKAKRGQNIMEVWKLMEASENKAQEEREAAAEIVEGNESSQNDEWIVVDIEGKESSPDKGQEEREAAADIVEGKESPQYKGQEEREAAADIMEGKESPQDKGQEEREAAADIMEGKESPQDKGQEEREAGPDIMEGKESPQDKGQEEREAGPDIMEGKESLQDKGQEEREAAADIMEGKESPHDKGQEEREAGADIMEGKESPQDKGQEEREAAADIMEGKESSQDEKWIAVDREGKESSQYKGQEEREAAADIMEGKESSQYKGQEEMEAGADIVEGKESSQYKGQVALLKRNEKQGQDLVEASEAEVITDIKASEVESEEEWEASEDKKIV